MVIDNLQAERGNDIPEFFLPGPNEFIPTNLEVEKKEITEVCQLLSI